MRWIFFLSLLFVYAEAFSKKLQVCTMTINSADESLSFQQNLSSEHFDFIELVPDPSDILDKDDERWLSKACQMKDLKCDLLIISGHFAGMFFGTDNNHTLSIYELEQMACRNECPNIFQNLKEVFLFGCNTMAHKGLIHRTPEEYLNILVEDYDMPKSMAELVVAGRFSVFDFTFKGKVEHIFSDKTRIYGFTELSPLGNQAQHALDQYFKGIRSEYGNYYNYLVKNFYQTQEKSVNNHFNQAFSPLSLVQQSYGMDSSHPWHHSFQQICQLYSDQVSSEEKLKTVQNLFESQESLMAMPAIKKFLEKKKDHFSEEEQILFNKIKRMEKVRQNFFSAYSSLSPHLIYIKSVVLHFLNIIGWLKQEDFQREITRILGPSVGRPSLQSFDVVETLLEYDRIDHRDILISFQDLPENYLQNIWSILLVDLLKINHPHLQSQLMDFCLESEQQGNLVICYQVFKTLGHLKTKDKNLLAKMAEFLHKEDEGLIYYALYGLAHARVKDSNIQFEIVKKMYHVSSWVRLQAIYALDYLGLFQQEELLRNFLREMLETEPSEKVILAGKEALRKVAQ